MGVGLELFALHKDGSEVPVDISLSLIAVESDTFVIAAIRDATERRRAEELKKSEAVLRESEERFRSIASAAPALIWMSGPDKKCTYFNETWLQFTGRSMEEELGNGWAEGVHPEDLQRCLHTYTQCFDRRERFRMEYRLRRRDGEYRNILDDGMPRFNQGHSFAGYLDIGVDITDRKLADEIRQEMTQKLFEVQEKERTRIGRELHDDISQRLALLLLEIQRVKAVLPASAGELRGRMDELEKRTSEITNDVQSLSHELHSSGLEYLGLVPAMKSFCKEFGDKHKVQVDFDSEAVPTTLPHEVSLCLFRVMQEALHNALKHSGVRIFEVKLRGSPTEIHLTVKDSGVGYEPELVRNTQGLGLTSMQERVSLVKGGISVQSKPRSGTEVNIRIPLSAHTQTEQARTAGT